MLMNVIKKLIYKKNLFHLLLHVPLSTRTTFTQEYLNYYIYVFPWRVYTQLINIACFIIMVFVVRLPGVVYLAQFHTASLNQTVCIWESLAKIHIQKWKRVPNILWKWTFQSAWFGRKIEVAPHHKGWGKARSVGWVTRADFQQELE